MLLATFWILRAFLTIHSLESIIHSARRSYIDETSCRWIICIVRGGLVRLSYYVYWTDIGKNAVNFKLNNKNLIKIDHCITHQEDQSRGTRTTISSSWRNITLVGGKISGRDTRFYIDLDPQSRQVKRKAKLVWLRCWPGTPTEKYVVWNQT